MALILLNKGRSALVDDADLPALSIFKWRLLHTGKVPHATGPYAVRYGTEGEPKTVMMHRQLMGLGAYDNRVQVDHINGDGLDNRRANLRLVTHRENAQNRKRHSTGRSGFKGVYPVDKSPKFYACIKYDGKIRHLGTFNEAKEAAQAYDDAARKHFGAYARTNQALGLL